jgi:RNA polymerase sigma factor (TIGR02999 family)
MPDPGFGSSLENCAKRKVKGSTSFKKIFLRAGCRGTALTRGGVGDIFAALGTFNLGPELQPPSQAVTELLVRWRAGDQEALQDLIPLVYEELRIIARRHMQAERPGHTLQSHALVHEAYLRLIDQRPFDTRNRAHFLAVASRLMRQILVDHARRHGAAKRGADQRTEIDGSMGLPRTPRVELAALDDALKSLAELDEQQARIVEMRFFGGLAIEEIAEVLGSSRSTIKREWNVAKAWLAREMKRGRDGTAGTVAKN